MYDQTTKSFTLRDASDSYAWLWENMDATDCASMTDEQIYAWVDEQISYSKEQDTYAIEERAETLSYPVFGYTTAEKFENADEYIAFKLEELNSDMQKERESAFSAIKAWIAFSTTDQLCEVGIQVQVTMEKDFELDGIKFRVYRDILWSDGGEYDDLVIRELPEVAALDHRDAVATIVIINKELREAREHQEYLAEPSDE